MLPFGFGEFGFRPAKTLGRRLLTTNLAQSSRLSTLPPMTVSNTQPNPNILEELVRHSMPFGKYKGTLLCDLPVSYLEWFAAKGFPAGKLGMQLATMYEIKINGLDYLLAPLRKRFPKR